MSFTHLADASSKGLKEDGFIKHILYLFSYEQKHHEQKYHVQNSFPCNKLRA